MTSTDKSTAASAADTSRHMALGLSEQNLKEMYHKLLLSRALDERTWMLQHQGKAPFVISCQGHEAAQVGSAYALRAGRDWLLPYYRDVGVVLTIGMTPRELMLASLARAADPSSGGRQMPGHFGHARLRIISGSSPVATQIPQACGVALASKIRHEDDVTVVYFGDGATSKGDFHEAMNFAGIHRLPVIFICENNGWAISVPQHKQMAIRDVADRAEGYGFPGVVVDGGDVLAVYQSTKQAAERARRGEGPTLIEAKVVRITPHSSDDDDRAYRDRAEVETWKVTKDPIIRFRKYLMDAGILTEEEDKRLHERVTSEVDDATDFAEKSPLPRPESALEHVFAE
ncbi:MAG: thiamine pyrophosphate-dependent dehydrogenase E1 component subunit alpha [Chloroflexota bacterium]|nr:MAG: thiamine pyrophosphate-dependent dehydrogenase E1 component subunit alpha [Chloroflexota bacterium]